VLYGYKLTKPSRGPMTLHFRTSGLVISHAKLLVPTSVYKSLTRKEGEAKSAQESTEATKKTSDDLENT
jgi:hypothetical protein